MSEGNRHWVRRIAWAAVIGQIVFVADCLISGLLAPRYSFIDNDTSDLGAKTAPNALLYNVALCASGLLTLGAPFVIAKTLEKSWLRTIGVALVAVFGAGQVIDGIFREDCPVSVDAVCRAAEKADQISTMHMVHNVESLFTFGSLLAAPIVLGFAFRQSDRWRDLAAVSFGSGVIQLICLPLFLWMYDSGASGQGVVEIVQFLAGVGWLALVCRRAASFEPCRFDAGAWAARRTRSG